MRLLANVIKEAWSVIVILFGLDISFNLLAPPISISEHSIATGLSMLFSLGILLLLYSVVTIPKKRLWLFLSLLSLALSVYILFYIYYPLQDTHVVFCDKLQQNFIIGEQLTSKGQHIYNKGYTEPCSLLQTALGDAFKIWSDVPKFKSTLLKLYVLFILSFNSAILILSLLILKDKNSLTNKPKDSTN
jgi:hypothetical protein